MCKPCSKPAFQKFHHLVIGQLPRADQKTFQHSPARTDKTIFIMLHSFCRAYEKAGIFLAFIILQTDDEALLGINIKKKLYLSSEIIEDQRIIRIAIPV